MNDRPWLSSYDEGVPKTLEYPQKTIPELLETMAGRFPDRPFLHYYGTTLTYRQVNGLVHRFAALLQKEGIKPGDRVALYLPNCPPCVIAFFGVLRAGAILTQLNPLYSATEPPTN